MNTIATELHPDLVPYIETGPPIGPTVDHPLVRNLRMKTPDDVLFINECYAFKKEALTKAAKTRNWPTYIFTHERPYRAQALYDLNYAQDLKPKEYWSILGEVWKDSNNIWQNIDTWEELWEVGEDNPHRKFAMTVQDRKALKLLPDEFTVWRGVSHREGVTGLSWTINRDVAIWFAHRRGEPHIATGRVRKADMMAMFMGGKESEIVVSASEVRKLKIKAFPALTEEELTNLKAGLGWR